MAAMEISQGGDRSCPIPGGEVNLTAPDSRRVKGNRRYIQGCIACRMAGPEVG